MVRTLWDTNLIRITLICINTGGNMSELEMKTVEEMHRMTIEELRAYRSNMLTHRADIHTILEYRERIGDDNNPYLLEAKNVVITGDDEE